MGTRGGVRRGPDGKPLQGRKKGIPNKNPTKRQEARRVAIANLAISEQAVLEETAKIAFGNMLDFIRIGPDGLPYTDFSKLTRAQAAAIGKIKVTTRTETQMVDGEKVTVPVREVQFDLAAKVPALRLLGEHFDAWKGQIKDPEKPEAELHSDRDRAKALAAFIAKTKAQA